VAYSHDTGPAAPIIAVLGHWLTRTEITINSVSLVAQTQLGRSWQWQTVAEVHLTDPGGKTARVTAGGS
jgi:hypothetical protein